MRIHAQFIPPRKHSHSAVKYHGFVNIDTADGGIPSAPAIEKAAKLLKTSKKAARDMHPLFARGLDTPLDMTVGILLISLRCIILVIISFMISFLLTAVFIGRHILISQPDQLS